MVLPVDTNNKRHLFLLDTGSSLTVFDNSLRAELGERAGTISATTLTGSAPFEVFAAPRALVGAQALSGVTEVACANFEPLRSASGVEVYGILGLDFLASRIVRVDFDRGEVALLRRVPEGSGVPVPMSIDPPRPPAVRMTVAGAGALSFLVDTGANREGRLGAAVLATLVGKGRAVSVGKATFVSVAGSGSGQRARLDEIAVGEFRHHGIVFAEEAGPDNSLELGYLSRYVVTFDFPGKTMYLKPGARFDEPSRYDLSGLHILRVNDATTIRVVDRYSAADHAGLRRHDIIEEVDSQPASSLSLAEIRNALSCPDRHTLVVSRGKERLRFVMDLEQSPEDLARADESRQRPPMEPAIRR